MQEPDLKKKIADVINCLSRENDSNTPDFLLAAFLVSCLDAFELASNKREVWYGVHLDISSDWKGLIMRALGEASMCWSETPIGVFDSDKAEQIGEKLFEDIKAEPKTRTEDS